MKRDRRKRSRRRRRSASPPAAPEAGAGAWAGAEGGAGGCEGGCGRPRAAWQGQGQGLWVPVTPQMLVIAIKTLRREKRTLTEASIADFVQERYPVRAAALARLEVARKLRCACAVGIALRARGRFRLPRNRGTRMRLNPQEVSAFWRAYLSDRQGPQGPPACPPDLCAGRRSSRRLLACAPAPAASSPLLVALDSSDDEDEEMAEGDGDREYSPPAET